MTGEPGVGWPSIVERARQEEIADSETAVAVAVEELSAQLSEITSRLERIRQTLDLQGSQGACTTLR